MNVLQRGASIALALAIAPVGGCRHAPVPLAEPPAKDAALEVRTAYYDDHRVLAVRSDPGQGQLAWAVLGNGQRIEDPRALIPAVPPTSPTALAIQSSEDARTESRWWTGAMVGTMTAGYLTMSIPLAVFDPVGPTSDADLALGVGSIVVGTGLVLASLPMLLMSLDAATRANREAETAFISYDRNLRRQVALPPRAAIIAPDEVLLEATSPTPTATPTPASPPSSTPPSPPEPIVDVTAP